MVASLSCAAAGVLDDLGHHQQRSCDVETNVKVPAVRRDLSRLAVDLVVAGFAIAGAALMSFLV
jgi:hypothetical protein